MNDKQAKREQRERDLAAKILALPEKKFGVLYVDAGWRFEPYSRVTGMDRAADNYYATSTLEQIKAIDVASIAAPDCVLFMWATAPMMPQALEVMEAWGFTYKSQVIWDKEIIGTDFWFRNRSLAELHHAKMKALIIEHGGERGIPDQAWSQFGREMLGWQREHVDSKL